MKQLQRFFPTQYQAPSTWLSTSGIQIFFQVCSVKLKENVISANRELSQTPTMGFVGFRIISWALALPREIMALLQMVISLI